MRVKSGEVLKVGSKGQGRAVDWLQTERVSECHTKESAPCSVGNEESGRIFKNLSEELEIHTS